MKRFILTMILGIAITVISWQGLKAFGQKSSEDENYAAATVLKTGSPLNGFSLIDTENKTFNLQSLKGHWTLLFFGYAQCKDICPKNLSIITELFRNFPSQNFVKPRFIFV